MATKLHRWSLRSRSLGDWQSPEEVGACLFGIVSGHPRHIDGKEVVTTPLVRCEANRVVTRSGSEYELGSSDPAYERLFPGALQRLLARLQKGATPALLATEASENGCASKVGRFLFTVLMKRGTS